MAIAKEIRSKISSIKSTQKITKAMEMVAASKLKKTQDRMSMSQAYANKIRDVVHHLASGHSEYQHPYIEQREIKNSGLIIVGTDRGLCGALNANVFRVALAQMKDWREKQHNIMLATLGNKAFNFFRRFNVDIIGHAEHIGDMPDIGNLIGVIKVMLDAYLERKIDSVFLLYNKFYSTMSQKPEILQLLPITPSKEIELNYYWDYIYEPDSHTLIDELFKRYLEMQLYQAVVENIACEQAARMVAMKNATDNAGELIGDLQLVYNKARQAAITKEIAEIVGGAAAIA